MNPNGQTVHLEEIRAAVYKLLDWVQNRGPKPQSESTFETMWLLVKVSFVFATIGILAFVAVIFGGVFFSPGDVKSYAIDRLTEIREEL
jgi:hypothetical protein